MEKVTSRLWLRRLLWYSPLRRFLFPRYQYSFSPQQLCHLLSLFDRAYREDCVAVEVGCFAGSTTVFLNKHLEYGHRRMIPYYALDTFSGFVRGDLARERDRGKHTARFGNMFDINSKRWFDYTMALNGLANVTAVECDINASPLPEAMREICFALVDVDLYQPTLSALRRLRPLCRAGATVVVDDCIPESEFDGALQALHEFSHEADLPFVIAAGKLGVIEVP
jgi:O-methyltransferase